MTVEIIGGGAIGMLYGARLALSGCKVRIWTRTEEQAQILNREGIRFTDLNGSAAVAAVTGAWSRSSPAADKPAWILLAVKQTAIGAPLFDLLRQLAASDTPVVCLQNGIGHMEKLCAALPDVPFFQAVTTDGALRTEACGVQHTGAGSLWMDRRPWQPKHRKARDGAEAAGSPLSDALERMAADLGKAGIDAHFAKDAEEIDAMVMRKLLVNAVINPLTAIYGVKNGRLPRDPIRLRLMRAVFDETISVLEAVRGRAFQADMWAHILEVCEATAGNESSMLADVKAQRETEVRWISGGVCELARRKQLDAPLNAAMVTLVERLAGEGQSKPRP